MSNPTSGDTQFKKEVEANVYVVLESFPATVKTLKDIQKAQTMDALCTKLFKYCDKGWPHKALYQMP